MGTMTIWPWTISVHNVHMVVVRRRMVSVQRVKQMYGYFTHIYIYIYTYVFLARLHQTSRVIARGTLNKLLPTSHELLLESALQDWV